MKKKVCICGGGNLGHVVAGFLAAHNACEVALLTRHPQAWSNQLTVRCPDGTLLKGTIDRISDDAQDVIPQTDIVILCLPGYSIQEEIQRIRPCLQPNTTIGSIVGSTGFFFDAQRLLPPDTPLFAFQRVPFIARIVEYGHIADLLGYKPQLHVAIEQLTDKEPLRAILEQLFRTPTLLLGSHYEVSLTNSNPLLHTSRLYTMWHNWHKGIVYPAKPLFYEEWTDEASQQLIRMDDEFFKLLTVLPVRKGSIPTILEYYEAADAASLTRKLRAIPAFKGITAPMRAVAGGFVPDFQSRYFTEDFPYGLRIIQQQAHQNHIPIPTIDCVMDWGEQIIR